MSTLPSSGPQGFVLAHQDTPHTEEQREPGVGPSSSPFVPLPRVTTRPLISSLQQNKRESFGGESLILAPLCPHGDRGPRMGFSNNLDGGETTTFPLWNTRNAFHLVHPRLQARDGAEESKSRY